MKTLEDYIAHMDQLLNRLVKVATQLRDLSLKVISEEELAPLQKHQEQLLAELEKVDQKIQRNFPHQVDVTIQENVHSQLRTFQELNREFIQNLNTSHGIIQFDFRHLQGEGEKDFSLLSRLKKSSPFLNNFKSEEPKETQEGM